MDTKRVARERFKGKQRRRASGLWARRIIDGARELSRKRNGLKPAPVAPTPDCSRMVLRDLTTEQVAAYWDEKRKGA